MNAVPTGLTHCSHGKMKQRVNVQGEGSEVGINMNHRRTQTIFNVK